MKIFKVATLMALGATSYALYDKYGKCAMKKMSKKTFKTVSDATNKLDDMM